ncbi:Enzymatic polyprotein [Cucumis melo var. makuwa]|uniref:Enzymatic polyprotein n=1 Tax=Cucumis melo var. makuwa TaxID=1194695 RepID=A0A5A7T975_CUCMM|nr:Enzymatic polyprotein [Cucumis melo var. makuwa]
MSAENYAMDLQFEQVSRRRQGSAQRTLTIQSDSSSLPPIPSTALLRPSGPTTPNKRVASPAASSSRSAIPRNPSSYSQIVRPKIFQPRPPINGYFTKTTMVDLTIEPEFDGPSVQEVCSQIFPHGFNFLPEDLSKTRTFYEYILVDSKSAEITHVPDKNDPSKIIYSKLRIFRVLTPSYWKQGMFLGPLGNFKALSKSLRIKWWEKFNYSHLEVNKIKDWFKANIHLQDMTRQEDEAFLLTKNAVMSTLVGASTQQEFNSVVNNVVVNLSDDNDDLPEDVSPASVNNVDDLDYDPYEGLDINDPFLDTQPY